MPDYTRGTTLNWLVANLESLLQKTTPDTGNIPKLLPQEGSSNIEDRRSGLDEQSRIDQLWQEDAERVRRAMTNSILRRQQNSTDAFGPEGEMANIKGITSGLFPEANKTIADSVIATFSR